MMKRKRIIQLFSTIVLIILSCYNSIAIAETVSTKYKTGLIEMPNDIFILLTICSMLLVTFYIARDRYVMRVKKNSAIYNSIIELNKRYTFHSDIPMKYSITHAVRSKQALEHEDGSGIILGLMYSDENIKLIFDKLTYNRARYEDYTEECNQLVEQYGFCDHASQKKTEYKLFEKEKLKPICDTDIYITLEYTSAKGKNRYYRQFRSSYKNLLSAYQDAMRRKAMRYQVQVERAKMSDSLRYKVLTRDGHRCVICGASASDGVKLHVDHILPVSKGGKTEMSNLRTLCERCNLGKSDSYNYNGLN